MRHKNPFKGIAHSNGSSYNARHFRHVEGARDSRPAWPKRYRDDCLIYRLRMCTTDIRPFRDINPVPVSFCE